jgi:HNH endonuclease
MLAVMAKRVNERCPYSAPPYKQFTDDHIFPQFLGGQRTIRVCRDCNSRFGHSFEAEAAKQLKRLQVFISHFGLDLTANPVIWPSAITIDDRTYDLMPGPDGVQYRPTHPLIIRNEQGDIIGGQARSKVEAQRLTKSLIDSGKAKLVEIEASPRVVLEDVKLDVDLSYDANLFRFATKLAAAAVVYSRRDALIINSGIPAYLHGEQEWGTRIAFCDTSAVRRLRPGLSHAIYVELGRPSYAIVLLFGSQQVYVPLPQAEPHSFIAILDAITGVESIGEVPPVGLLAPPMAVSSGMVKSHLQQMVDILGAEAKARGAKRPPTLHLANVEHELRSSMWEDGTYRFLRILD